VGRLGSNVQTKGLPNLLWATDPGKQGSYLKIPHVYTLIPSTQNKTVAIRKPCTGSEAAARLIIGVLACACADVPKLNNFLISRCEKHGAVRAPRNKRYWLLVPGQSMPQDD